MLAEQVTGASAAEQSRPWPGPPRKSPCRWKYARAPGALGGGADHAGAAAGAAGDLMALVLVFVAFILLQKDDLRDRFVRLAGSGDMQRTTVALDEAASRLSRYLSLQTIINACFGFTIGLGLWLIGIPNAGLWALMACCSASCLMSAFRSPFCFRPRWRWRWIRAGQCWSG